MNYKIKNVRQWLAMHSNGYCPFRRLKHKQRALVECSVVFGLLVNNLGEPNTANREAAKSKYNLHEDDADLARYALV